MARRQITEITDDLDGSVLDPETVRSRVLSIDGREVTLDLSPSSSDKLDAALAPFLGPPPGFETFEKPRKRGPYKKRAAKVEEAPPVAVEEVPAAVKVAPVEEPEPAPVEVAPEVVTTSEACELLGLGNRRVSQLVTMGVLEVAGKRGHARTVTRASVEAYLNGDTRRRRRPGEGKRQHKPRGKAFDPEARCPRCGEVGETDPEVCRYCHDQGPWTPPAEVEADPVEAPRPRPASVHLEGGKIVPGVNLSLVDDRPDFSERKVYSGSTEDPPEGEALDEVALERTAVQWRDRYRDGLPGWAEFTYFPEVLAVGGMDFEIVETALRKPERVEVAPETFGRGYPILRFHRGDATTVLGLRSVSEPAIIAAYHGSLLANDRHRTGHLSGGGGGARKAQGLPRTVRQSIQRLATMGVRVDESDPNARTGAVTFKGDDLGKITLGATASRQQIESDYQRVVRKVEAITRRITA